MNGIKQIKLIKNELELGELNEINWHRFRYQARRWRDGDGACTLLHADVRSETPSRRWDESASATGESCFSLHIDSSCSYSICLIVSDTQIDT